MGVIYSVGDDVKDLLCPFIAEKGGTRDTTKIERLYRSASLGNMSASKFWEGVGIDPRLEDEYLQRHELTNGLVDFLAAIRERDYELWCLSNDLSEWSRKLRVRFGLDKYFRGFVISGDVGARKPDQAIFTYLIDQLHARPSEIIFVDDQRKNLDSAAALGFEAIFFSPVEYKVGDERHKVALTFNDLAVLLP